MELLGPLGFISALWSLGFLGRLACVTLTLAVGQQATALRVYRKSCRLANPEVCWKVTKRRSFLGAGDDFGECYFQAQRGPFLKPCEKDLMQQCDHKLMLGGMGVSVCGKCSYAPATRSSAAKLPWLRCGAAGSMAATGTAWMMPVTTCHATARHIRGLMTRSDRH